MNQKEYRLRKGITKRNQLSDQEIEKIIKLRSEGFSYSRISRIMDRNESTILKIVSKYSTK